jgi:HK97 gp10 family phage protein
MATARVDFDVEAVTAKVAAGAQVRVVLATARVETAMKHKVETPGPPRSKPGEPPHRDTSRLIQSIHSSVVQVGYKITGTVNVPVEYAQHLEYGTPKMAARPFARPTLAEERANIDAIMGAPNMVKA